MTGLQDQFLGEELQAAENDPATALFHLIPCPLEKTVSYGCGTAGGPAAILAASHQLERSTDAMEACTAGIFTQPALPCSGPIEQVLAALQERSRTLAAGGHLPVILGGEHSLSWAAVRGIQEALPGPLGWCKLMPMLISAKTFRASPIPMPASCGCWQKKACRSARSGCGPYVMRSNRRAGIMA